MLSNSHLWVGSPMRSNSNILSIAAANSLNYIPNGCLRDSNRTGDPAWTPPSQRGILPVKLKTPYRTPYGTRTRVSREKVECPRPARRTEHQISLRSRIRIAPATRLRPPASKAGKQPTVISPEIAVLTGLEPATTRETVGYSKPIELQYYFVEQTGIESHRRPGCISGASIQRIDHICHCSIQTKKASRVSGMLSYFDLIYLI